MKKVTVILSLLVLVAFAKAQQATATTRTAPSTHVMKADATPAANYSPPKNDAKCCQGHEAGKSCCKKSGATCDHGGKTCTHAANEKPAEQKGQ